MEQKVEGGQSETRTRVQAGTGNETYSKPLPKGEKWKSHSVETENRPHRHQQVLEEDREKGG